jgi:hypothetical protein
MICQDIVYLFRQLLQQVQQQTWLVIDEFRSDLGNLILAFRINAMQYKAILISSGILRRRGNDYRVIINYMIYKDNSNQTSQYKLPDLSYNTGTIGTILSQLESLSIERQICNSAIIIAFEEMPSRLSVMIVL